MHESAMGWMQSIKQTIKSGQVVGIVGPTGSSKSPLLMAKLREITPHGLAGSRLEATVPAGTMTVEMDRVRSAHATPAKGDAFRCDS